VVEVSSCSVQVDEANVTEPPKAEPMSSVAPGLTVRFCGLAPWIAMVTLCTAVPPKLSATVTA
jgi:hypothetical protein